MDTDASDAGDLASRWVRLGAALLDGLIMMVVILPIQWFGGFLPAAMNAAQNGYSLPFGTLLLWSLIGLVVFVAIQGWPLHQSGQTWGKRAVSIRITDLDGNKPPLLRLLGLRYLPMQAASLVPVVGPLVGFINPLFIFRQDRRCLHDLIAGTRVVNVR
ncbi:MAG TPA: RDD family protein [Tahibacter sp.]|uniref:RDD family protein n=1 Tax=Tahibacter sp. TaxID=2056211 RepID=UPI002C105D24|nr:RDD family protein [Tahibacter sp.]HSX59453.1 RDD family protein [Tahibacter sp.]